MFDCAYSNNISTFEINVKIVVGKEGMDTHRARLSVVCSFCSLLADMAITCPSYICMSVTGEHEKISCK